MPSIVALKAPPAGPRWGGGTEGSAAPHATQTAAASGFWVPQCGQAGIAADYSKALAPDPLERKVAQGLCPVRSSLDRGG
jgi:hypothetical protein